MRYIITLICVLIIMAYEYKKHKHILAAPVVYPILWVLSLLGLMIDPVYYQVSIGTLALIVIGYILFCIAFDHGNRNGCGTDIYHTHFDDSSISIGGLNIAFALALVIGLIYLIKVRNYISLTSIVQSLTAIRSNTASGNLVLPTYLSYLSGMVQCTLRIFLLLYLRNSVNGMNKNSFIQVKLRFRLIVLTFLSVIILLTNFSRNGLLYFILPLIFIVCITKKISNKIIVLIGLVSLIAFISIFVWFSSFRDAYLYVGNDFWEVALDSFSLYLSGGIVALDQAIKTGILSVIAFDGGKHTFAFLTAIIDMVFNTNITPDVVLGSISIGPRVGTNVYTVYYWTALDFGVVYSVIIQLFYGWIHGRFYYKMRNGSLRDAYWYCLLSYPLIMMFFEEQYFSIGQSWVIRIFVYLVIGTLCGITRFVFGTKGRG